ncbi:MAG TPA: matrixin family metalloprotease, partial [Kofleriaceae bacterium]
YINETLAHAQLPIVVAHELGHAFGLVHVSDRPSLMNPGNVTTPPNESDRQALAGLWGTCDAP